MRNQKLSALLLTLAMALTLAACGEPGPTAEQRAQQKQAALTGAAPTCESLIAALEQSYHEPELSLRDRMAVCWGAAFADAMQGFLDAAAEMGEAPPERLGGIDLLGLGISAPGSEVKLQIASSTPLNAEEIAAYQEKLKSASGSMELIRSLSGVYDNMSEEQLAESGMTAEAAAQMQRYVDALMQIGAVYDAATVEEGRALRLSAVVDGNAAELETTALRINGSWVIGDFMDILG